MQKYVLIILCGLFVLLSGCVVKEAVDNSESNLPTQEEGFGVSLFTEKEIYQREEPFNLTLNIDYDGEPFKAAIIYDSYRKGFSKHFYKGYIEDVSSKGINRSRFHAGYPAEKAFRIHDGGHSYPKNFFLDEGTYYISVYVYDCEKIVEEGYSCNPSHVFPSTFGISDDTPEDLIKHNVKPLASAEKEIIVKGGSIECSSDSDCSDKGCSNCVLGHYRCGDFFSKPKCIECNGEMVVNGERTMCKEGYTCKNYQCVEDPLYCQNDEDCDICEGCQDNKQFCDNMNQCQDCHWSKRPCQKGHICEDWGCTNIEVLEKIDDCKPMETCGESDRRTNPEIKCTMSSDSSKNMKCLECWSDSSCKEGYHCFNYNCVAG